MFTKWECEWNEEYGSHYHGGLYSLVGDDGDALLVAEIDIYSYDPDNSLIDQADWTSDLWSTFVAFTGDPELAYDAYCGNPDARRAINEKISEYGTCLQFVEDFRISNDLPIGLRALAIAKLILDFRRINREDMAPLIFERTDAEPSFWDWIKLVPSLSVKDSVIVDLDARFDDQRLIDDWDWEPSTEPVGADNRPPPVG